MKTRHTLSGGLGLIAAIAMALPATAGMPSPAVAPSATVVASAGTSSSGPASAATTLTSPLSAASEDVDEGCESNADGKALLTKEATEAGRKAVGPRPLSRSRWRPTGPPNG